MEDWQAETIYSANRGYDSIFVAGTGYGKSLVFHGLAVLNKKKVNIVISPLKALERDQVAEAKLKDLKAEMINEHTVCPEMWANLRQGKAQLYYVSPEMVLSPAFCSLWRDASFRKRIHAVIVDEAHCIAEWGDGFRSEYGSLSKLRSFIGQEIPVIACTATCTSETFDVIWSSLTFGFRPFWGIDVGCTRENLTYIIRKLENTKNPVLDALSLLPQTIPPHAAKDILPKCLFYFETVGNCTSAVETLRKILPAHLRDQVQSFVGLTSEAAKERLWEKFRAGEIKILCATEAAGMGCNVSDVQFVALFCAPRSLSVLVQRWGRGARNRSISATCFLFVQAWAFHPKEVYKSGKRKGKPAEPKSYAASRAKLDPALEELINLESGERK
ncbi:P-loop containing nucleoside triphosphate hydrolase protein [Pluteus cervinus]|uniref:P-loop containing nucleoside triphosphate hydrolase protein n=1 Tax=Pluteus cervinus TaxID=181527 RepID=A0ACD2ZZS6_9AGAR|nr:P-loop containing nucleoside triphosphate hydrolase protein [Pluteus cervinus]